MTRFSDHLGGRFSFSLRNSIKAGASTELAVGGPLTKLDDGHYLDEPLKVSVAGLGCGGNSKIEGGSVHEDLVNHPTRDGPRPTFSIQLKPTVLSDCGASN